MNSPWQRRIRRAEELLAQHAFASEILAFYIQLAGAQEKISREFELKQPSAGGETWIAELSGEQLSVIGSRFDSFLAALQSQGPAEMARLGAELRTTVSWPPPLNAAWSAAAPSEPSLILAQAFLQPYAELLRACRPLTQIKAGHAVCPFCRRKPCFGILRQMGEGASRSMVCAFCMAGWDFRRLVCPGCGEEDDRKLPIYTADIFNYIRVECCDSCKTYIKTIDLTKNGNAEPVVDELASAPLDLWVRERGYAKLHHNLLGM